MLIVLLLLAVGVFPSWPHSRSWGYTPVGVVGLVLIFGRAAADGAHLKAWP